MARYTLSTYMLLRQINEQETNWYVDWVYNFARFDQHDHSSGKGKQIPTGGIADGAITNVKISGSAAISGTKISPDFGTSNIITGGDLRLEDSAGTKYVNLSAPTTVATSYTLTLPDAVSAASDIASFDGSGNITFQKLVNANISATAAIAGTKISPNFGAQDITTTGSLNAPSLTVDSSDVIVSTTTSGDVELNPVSTIARIMGATAGSSGEKYLIFGNEATGGTETGIRNNAGTIEYKNSAGSWTSFSTSGGDTVAPASNTDNYIPQWDGADSKTLKNGLALGISDNSVVQIDSASVASGEYAKFTASGLESKSFSEVKTDLDILTKTIEINDQTGTTYTLQSSDNGKLVTLNNASAITVTVPSGLGAGFNCQLLQLGAGQVSVSESSTTINNADSHTSLTGQYSSASLVAYAADTFLFQGDTA